MPILPGVVGCFLPSFAQRPVIRDPKRIEKIDCRVTKDAGVISLPKKFMFTEVSA